MVKRIRVAVTALSVLFLAVVLPRGAQAGSPRDVPSSSSLVTLGGAYRWKPEAVSATREAFGSPRAARSTCSGSRRARW